MNKIISEIANYFSLTVDEVKSKRKFASYVYARQMACYILRYKHKASTVEIGRFLNIDHATVIHGSRKIEDYMSYDKKVVEDLQNLKAILGFNSLGFNGFKDSIKLNRCH